MIYVTSSRNVINVNIALKWSMGFVEICNFSLEAAN